MGVKAERALGTRAVLVAGRPRTVCRRRATPRAGRRRSSPTAGLTRGALYHHFADKQALFAAVCEDLHGEAERVIETDADAAPTAFDGLVAGCLGFLDFMVRPDVRRILILDAPSVLGREAWNEMDRRHGFGLLIAGVEAAVAEGGLAGDPDSRRDDQRRAQLRRGLGRPVAGPRSADAARGRLRRHDGTVETLNITVRVVTRDKPGDDERRPAEAPRVAPAKYPQEAVR